MDEDELGLNGKVAVVAGGSAGWGSGIAVALGTAGARVVVAARGDAVWDVVERIRLAGGGAIGVQGPLDVGDGVARLLRAALDAFGRVDVWVNSLGLARPGRLLEMTEDDWDDLIRVQLRSVFLGTQAAARHMVEHGVRGRIINMGGSAGLYGMPQMGGHAASKGGVLAATFTWAEELAPHGITVNALRGGVASPNMDLVLSGTVLAGERSGSPSPADLGFHDPDFAAPLAVWLASDAACDVTGWHLGIDGEVVTVYGRSPQLVQLRTSGSWTVEELQARLGPAVADLDLGSNAMTQLQPRAAGRAVVHAHISPVTVGDEP